MASLHDIWRGDIIPQSGVDVAVGRNSVDPPSPVVPLLDVHLRQNVFHDTGVDSNSGVVFYNALNRRLELIPSNSGAQPIVTAVLWDGYDSVGGNTISFVTTVVDINTERVNTHPEIFNFASDQVTIWTSGVYEFEYRVSVDATTTNRGSCRFNLARSAIGGGLFTEVAGSRSYTYNRTSAAGEDTANAKLILNDVEVGDVFEVRGIRIAGTDCVQIANASSLTIRKLA